MNKYNVGIIGLGEVAQLMHLPLLQRLINKYSITGIFDVSPKLMEYIAGQYAIPNVFATAETLIQSESNDIVFILSPDHYHFAHCMMALKSNKHVFIEKPICLMSDHLDEIIDVHKNSANLVGMVGYMRRYAVPFTLLKDKIQDKKIEYVKISDIICEGPFFIRQSNSIFYPEDINSEILAESQQSLMDQLKHVLGEKQDASIYKSYRVLTGLCSHSLSAMRELFGIPKSVKCVSIKKMGTMIVVLFDYEKFLVNYECLIHDAVHFDASIEVFTDYGKYFVNYNTPYIRNLPMSLFQTESNELTTETIEFGPYYTDPFSIELEILYNCIEHKQSPKTNFEDSKEDFILFDKIIKMI